MVVKKKENIKIAATPKKVPYVPNALQASDNQAAVNNELDKVKADLASRRKSKQQDAPEFKPVAPPPVSLGPVGAIVDALINTGPEKMLELTDLDRNQVSLIPQVVVVDDMWDYLEQITLFRSDSDYYTKLYQRKFPETPDTTGKFVQLLAKCRRSLGGKTQKALEDLALADLETRANDDNMGGAGGHDFED